MFQRLLLPLGPEVDQARVLMPTTLLSSWFDTAVQILCSDEDDLETYQILAAGLGAPIEPVTMLEEPMIEGLVAFAHGLAPSLIVVEPTPHGMAIAAESTEPVFLVAENIGHRMPVGPLVAEITGGPGDLDALALTAALAKALKEPVRLVVGTDSTAADDGPSSADRLADAEARLRQMGCEVGVDSLRAHGLHPLVLVGRTREATAMIISQDRLSEPGLVERACAQGVNVVVAPVPRAGAGRAAPFEVNLGLARDAAPSGATLQVLDRTECMDRLQRHTVARLGYVDAGWPTIVPINYRLHGGDIFIRSLAGGKLRAAEREDTVCLELDGYEEALRTGWSVVAHGNLELITDGATLREAWVNDPQPWVASEEWQWLRMVPFSVSGREVWPSS